MMTYPRTSAGSDEPPNGLWKYDLPAWAVLILDRNVPGWRTRYHHFGNGLADRGGIVVALTGPPVLIFMRKGD